MLGSANRTTVKATYTPLTEQETFELSELLEACGGASLDFAHGVFAAVASAPTPRDVTDWLPLVVGDQVPDKATLERMFALLMRDFHACKDCLALGVPAVPAPGDADAITRYSKGYVRITHADARWKADVNAFALTVPFAALSGYVSPESLAVLQPEAASDPAGWLAQQRQDLADSAARLYTYWAQARAEKNAQVSSRGKVGRNEPCPCQSGKKYKRCCGAS